MSPCPSNTDKGGGGWRQTLACQGMQCLGGGVAKASARVAYCGLFFLSMLLCWVLRDYAQPMLEKLPCAFADCGPPSGAPQDSTLWGTSTWLSVSLD